MNHEIIIRNMIKEDQREILDFIGGEREMEYFENAAADNNNMYVLIYAGKVVAALYGRFDNELCIASWTAVDPSYPGDSVVYAFACCLASILSRKTGIDPVIVKRIFS